MWPPPIVLRTLSFHFDISESSSLYLIFPSSLKTSPPPPKQQEGGAQASTILKPRTNLRSLTVEPQTSKLPSRPLSHIHITSEHNMASPTSALHGSCACERNQYTILVPTSSVSDVQVFFDNSAANRKSSPPSPTHNTFSNVEAMKVTADELLE